VKSTGLPQALGLDFETLLGIFSQTAGPILGQPCGCQVQRLRGGAARIAAAEPRAPAPADPADLRSGPARGGYAPLAFCTANRFRMALCVWVCRALDGKHTRFPARAVLSGRSITCFAPCARRARARAHRLATGGSHQPCVAQPLALALPCSIT
jgi:hypothetical protein